MAEAAKAIENVQRDLNIALMNELAIICDRIGIRTRDVLDAARTKWNFLRFDPGLVGGHCIGVDPYYMTTLAESVGYHPQVILAGRRINESMGAFVAQRLVKFLACSGGRIKDARVGLLGLTFKQDVRDSATAKSSTFCASSGSSASNPSSTTRSWRVRMRCATTACTCSRGRSWSGSTR